MASKTQPGLLLVSGLVFYTLAANDRVAKLMEKKDAAPVAKRTRLGLGTNWKPKVSNNSAILVGFVVAKCPLATILLVEHCRW